jgi:hypothetical protein
MCFVEATQINADFARFTSIYAEKSGKSAPSLRSKKPVSGSEILCSLQLLRMTQTGRLRWS